MNRILKKSLAMFLAVIMTLGILPVTEFSIDAKAANPVKDYNATAAAEYAQRYALSYNREWYFYHDGGDCANFVSQCLYAGGMQMDGTWACLDFGNNGYRMWEPCTWIRAPRLLEYLVDNGGTLIWRPSADQIDLGDVIFYDWGWNGGIDHVAIVSSFSGATPLVCGHTSEEWAGKLNYDWHYGHDFADTNYCVVKLYGRKCTPNNAKSYEIYQTSYKDTDAIRITERNGNLGYGCIKRNGTYDWIDVSGLIHLGSWSKIEVNHIMGNWYTVTKPTCLTVGVEKRDCNRCDYSETRKTGGGSHQPGDAATCTTPQICTVCGVTLTPALGHVVGDWEVIQESTCVTPGKAVKYCSREGQPGCGYEREEKELPLAEHKYITAQNGATCTSEGWADYVCTVCGDKTSKEANLVGDQAFTDWVTERNEDLANSEYEETLVQYRYADKDLKTASTNTLSGYTLYDTTYVWGNYGSWSNWQTAAVSSSDSRKVETRSVKKYNYYHYSLDKGNGGQDRSTSPIDMASYNQVISSGRLNARYAVSESVHTTSLDYELSEDGYYRIGDCTVMSYIGYDDGCRYDNWNHLNDNWFQCGEYITYETQYRYADRSKIYTYHFYKWGNWSDWSETAAIASDNRKVETRPLYRYELTALGHDVEHLEEAEVKYATCTEDGYTKYKCPRCKSTLEEYTVTSSKTGHNMSAWEPLNSSQYAYRDSVVVSEDPSTYLISYCQNVDQNTNKPCTEKLLRNTADEDHSYKEVKRLEANCENDGYVKYECQSQDHTDTKTETLNKTGHKLKFSYTKKYATCTEPGIDVYVCTNFDPRTGTTCTYSEEKPIEPNGHTLVKTDEIPATCTTDGQKTYFTCTVCHKTFKDSAAQQEFTDFGELVVPALGHAPAHNCQDENCKQLIMHNSESFVEHIDGDCMNPAQDIYHCTRCGYEEIGYTFDIPHDYEVISDTEATCVTPRHIVKECKVCNDIEDSYIGNPLGHEFKKSDGTTTHDFEEDGVVWDNDVDVTCTINGVQHVDCIRYGTGNCIERHERIIPAPGHTWGEPVHHRTCTIADAVKHTCTVCDVTEIIEDIQDTPLGHYSLDECYHERKEAGCYEWGYEKWICKRVNDGVVCDTVVKEIKIPPNHTFVEVTVNPTCEEDGCRKLVCSVCSYEQIEATTKKLGHDLENLVQANIIKATCTEDGKIEYKCVRNNNGKICNTVIDEKAVNIPAREHKMGEWYSVVSPNCVEPGLERRDCQNTTATDKYESCTYYETREPGTNDDHDWGEITYTWSADNSTCTALKPCNRDHKHDNTETVTASVVTVDSKCLEKGSTTYTATFTNNEFATQIKVVEIEAKGHDWGEWTVETPATCTEKGLEKRVCKNDATHVETRDLDIDPDAHDWDDGVVTTVPTCKDEGVKTYTCKINSEHTRTEPVAVDPNNHVGGTYVKDAKDPTCTENGYTGDTYCKGCDEKLASGEDKPAHGHNYVPKDSKAATYDAPGYKYYECTYDATHNRKEDIPVLVSYRANFVVPADKVTADILKKNGYEDVTTVTLDGTQYYVIKSVRFGENATVLNSSEIPTVPSMGDIYIAAWEDYTLRNEDLYIKAVYTLKSSDNESDLIGDKKVQYENGTATVTLSAFAETLNAKVKYGAEPYDIVLILDKSSSMTNSKNNMSTGETRLAALQKAANEFVNMVYGSAQSAEVDHRIAIVCFNEKSKIMTGTGADAFLSVTESKDRLKSIINNNDVTKQTRSDLALADAEYLVSQKNAADAANGVERKKLVIFFTDGEPTNFSEAGYSQGGFTPPVANAAIDHANKIKNQQNANIYCVGLTTDADANYMPNVNANTLATQLNTFLHLVSSNYQGATDMKNFGSQAQSGYYLSTKNSTNELVTIFKDIFTQKISNNITFSNITFFDKISEYFTLTTQQEEALRNDLYRQYGVTNENIIITRNADGTTDIVIKSVNPKAVYENNVQTGYGATITYEVSANQNAINAGLYKATTDDNTGGIAKDDGVTVYKFTPEDEGIQISNGRVMIEYVVDGQTYAIKEAGIGDTITPVDGENLSWKIGNNDVVTHNYTCIEAEFADETRTITYVVGGSETTHTYYVGEIITVPEITAPEGKIFVGWDTVIPFRMGNDNITATARFVDHTHEWIVTGSTGLCTDGISTAYTCYCGKEKSETTAPCDHSYEASYALVDGNNTARIICTTCGYVYQEQTVIDYKIKDTVIDMTMLQNAETSIQPDGTITVKLAIPDNLKNSRNLKVYRVENNKKTEVPSAKEGDFLIVTLDHFSYYVISTEADGSDVPTYSQIICTFDGHTDNDNNGYCDVCDIDLGTQQPDDPSANCSHMCHKKGLIGFIWKIIKFFVRLFGMEQYRYCSCGKPHW